MKILSECEGFHTTEGILPSFPLTYLTCSSHFQEALGRSVQWDAGALLTRRLGIWHLPGEVLPSGQQTGSNAALQSGEGRDRGQRGSLSTQGAPECPHCLSQQLQEGCQARAPKFFLLGLLREVRGKEWGQLTDISRDIPGPTMCRRRDHIPPLAGNSPRTPPIQAPPLLSSWSPDAHDRKWRPPIHAGVPYHLREGCYLWELL